MTSIIRSLVFIAILVLGSAYGAERTPTTVASLLESLRSGDLTRQASAVGNTRAVDPAYNHQELKAAVGAALAEPYLVDYLFLDRGEFFAAVTGYFPELLRLTNVDILDAIESGNWLKANMGFYFLRLKKNSPAEVAKIFSPQLVLNEIIVQAASLHFGQVLERGKIAELPTVIPMINALTESPLVTPELVSQTADLMLMVLKNRRDLPQRQVDYVLGRMEGLIADGDRRPRRLGVAKVVEVYEALKTAGGVGTRNPFDSSDTHLSRWLRQHQINYDLLPQLLDHVAQEKQSYDQNLRHWNSVGYASPPDGSGRSDRIYSAWALIEQNPNLIHPERIRQFLEQVPGGAYLATVAHVAAPTALRQSGYVLPLIELYDPIASYSNGLAAAARWGQRTRLGAAEMAGVTVITGMQGLEEFVNELKSPSARAQANRLSADELAKLYAAEARAAYTEVLIHSLETRLTRMFQGQEADQLSNMEWILRSAFLSKSKFAPPFAETVSELYVKLLKTVTHGRDLTPAARTALGVLSTVDDTRPELTERTRENLRNIKERTTQLTVHPLRRKAEEVRARIRQIQMGLCRQTVRTTSGK